MKHHGGHTLIALICLGCFPVESSAQVEVWAIAPEVSRVQIDVGRAGLLSFAGHTHEVIAPALSGDVRLDPRQLERAEVTLTFDAAALKVTGEGEPAKDVPEVQRVMVSEKVLDVGKYPTIVFRSRQVAVRSREGSKARLQLVGDLTLHGVMRRVEVPVDIGLAATDLTATGRFTIKQTDFNIQPVSAGLGTVKVKDEVSVQFTLVAMK